MRALKAIWNFFGRADLTLYVLLALVADLCAGFFHFRAEPQIFGPLDRLMLLDWIETYGRFHLSETWWFFVFMVLMLLLVLNTVALHHQPRGRAGPHPGPGHGPAGLSAPLLSPI